MERPTGSAAPVRALFVSTVSSLEGGAERSLLELARALADAGRPPALAAWTAGPLVDGFRQEGLQTFVHAPGGAQPGRPLGGLAERVPGLPRLAAAALSLWLRVRPFRAEAAWLEALVRTHGFGVLHSNCDLSPPAAAAAAEASGAVYVAHVRDHWRRWRHPRIAAALRRAAAVLVQSEFMAREFVDAGLRLRVVPNPVDPRRLTRPIPPEERTGFRRFLGVTGRFAVACVGRLDTQKRPDVAIRAMAELDPGDRPATLLLAGDGAPVYRRRLERVAAGTAPDRVRFLGHRGDVQAWLPAVDALVVPSAREPFGRVIVEGLLAALPVVAVAEGAAPELIDDGGTGLLVDPPPAAASPARGSPGASTLSHAIAAALERVAADPEGARSMGERGREQALRRFHPARVAEAVAAIHDEVTG